MTQNEEIGRAMALQMYRLEHCGALTVQEACALLGCAKSTLYKKDLPHNGKYWKKQAVLDEMMK